LVDAYSPLLPPHFLLFVIAMILLLTVAIIIGNAKANL
jgi:hypothetical protein